MRKTGKLKSFDRDKGYGFIRPEDPSQGDVFFHIKHAIDLSTMARINTAGRNGVPILLCYELDPKFDRPRAKWVQET